MTQVWKCRFCENREVKRKTIDRHERECRSNPACRLCFTCRNYVHGSFICAEGIRVLNVYTSGRPCLRWAEKEEKRA